MMSRAAFSISAVSSTTAGGLPAPAPIAFLPDDITVFTMAGPPVATSMLIRGSLIRTLVLSMDGLVTVTTMFAGAPNWASLLLISSTAYSDTLRERGCGLNTTVLPAASMPMLLLIMVSVGLVVGVIEPITPNAEYSINVKPPSPETALVVRSSIPGVFSAATRF